MENQYGMCATCNQSLTDYQVQFDKRVERMSYLPMGDSEYQAIVNVLYCEELACYCSKDYACLGVHKELQARGIKNTGGSIGPVTSCAKCGSIIDMTQPHVHYVTMEVKVNKTPSQTSLTVHDEEGLADVCVKCDPDGALSATTQQSEPIAHAVVSPPLPIWSAEGPFVLNPDNGPMTPQCPCAWLPACWNAWALMLIFRIVICARNAELCCIRNQVSVME